MIDTAQNWHPGVGRRELRARAALLAMLRQFFERRGVLEVDTPLLGPTSVPDPAIAPLRADGGWLQTSPEAAMKRLLAAGSGDIYQLSHVFRGGELGRLHAREFTLLEWYRVGWSMDALIDEVLVLLDMALGPRVVTRTAYRDLVQARFDVDVHRAAPAALVSACARRLPVPDRLDASGALDLMYADAVAHHQGVLVVDAFPAAQAALARVETVDGRAVAQRFEVAVDGVELANGYAELTDAVEQRVRFERERSQRARNGQPVPPLDVALLGALEAGLPECSGVALGVDRLLMLAQGADRIQAVMPG